MKIQLTETLYFDWNDTGQDQNLAIRKAVYNLTGIYLSINNFREWDSPEVAKILGWTIKEWNSFAWGNPEILSVAPPFPGFAETLKRLKDRGHTVKILTAAPLGIEFIEEWFDKFNITSYDEIICNGDKISVIGKSTLFDDNPETIMECIKNKKNIVRFLRPWNEGLQCPTLKEWYT